MNSRKKRAKQQKRSRDSGKRRHKSMLPAPPTDERDVPPKSPFKWGGIGEV